MIDQRSVDHSTAFVAAASLVLGVLDVISTLLCVRLWVSTADFGAATLAIALFPILDRLGGMGLGAAIVRDTLDAGTRALSSVFWLGLGAATAVLVVLVIAHPLIGAAFGQPIIASLLAAYGVRLVIQNASVVPEALMRRDLRYRELSIIRVIASACETATKLSLAYAGAHGYPDLRIWCFAVGPVVNTAVTSVCVLSRSWWWPRLAFDRAIAARAARFVAALSGGELLYFAYTSADYLVVGAAFGDAAVGAYRLAYELVLDVVRLVSMVTAEVAFPTFARLAHDRVRVGGQLLRFTRQNLIVLAPFLVFVAVEADDLLALLYPPLPAAAATAARILCITGALRALGFIVPPMLAGIGEATRVLIYNAIAATVLPLAFVLGAQLGGDFVAVAWAWALGYPVAFVALLAMGLPRAGLHVRTYLRSLVGIAACAAGALGVGLAGRMLVDGVARVMIVGITIAGSYTLLLAWIERVTPRSVVRGFRADGSTTTVPAPGTARPPDT